MKYRDILGIPKKQPKKQPKKKVEKKVAPKPTAPPVTELLKKEFGDTINEGPAYEYADYMKNIEMAENIQAEEVNKLVKLLQKKGMKKEATALASTYMKSVRNFDKFLKKLERSLI